MKIVWLVIRNPVSLHRDFFIVLDLRLTKRLVDYREVKLPFVFYRGSLSPILQNAQISLLLQLKSIQSVS